MMAADPLLDELLGARPASEDETLAARLAPVILFDEREPFLPLAAGVTIFRATGPSDSFPRVVEVRDGEACTVEYAIWWDWDIGHLYELEHVWVSVDPAGRVVRVEASAHGGFAPMHDDGDPPALDDGRPVVYSEPGKHAFAADPAPWMARAPEKPRLSQTSFLAGIGGVLVKRDLFDGLIESSAHADRLARSYLSARSFHPSWRFTNRFALRREQLVAWPHLRRWIPRRVAWWVGRLPAQVADGDWRFLRIGHRGAAAHAPDNSMAGLVKAAELLADMVEIDVRTTLDGVPVLSHEPAAGGRVVAKTELSALRDADLGNGERIITLDEAVAFCRSEALGVYIELKDGASLAAVAEIVRARRARRLAIVASFSIDLVAEFSALAPDIATSILFRSPRVEPVALAQATGASYVHPCWERFENPTEHLTTDWVERVRGERLGVITWHEERPAVIAELRRLRVDGICSDDPRLLLDA